MIVPLLVVLFFGVLEFGLLFRNSHTINHASRAGARVASALPRADGYQDSVAATVAASIQGSLPSGTVERLVIFKADPTTGTPVDGDFVSCSTCWKYDWDEPTDSWVLADLVAQWPAADQSACGSLTDTDYVGVYVEGRYEWATGLFGAEKTLTEKTVMRLEPLPSTTVCSP